MKSFPSLSRAVNGDPCFILNFWKNSFNFSITSMHKSFTEASIRSSVQPRFESSYWQQRSVWPVFEANIERFFKFHEIYWSNLLLSRGYSHAEPSIPLKPRLTPRLRNSRSLSSFKSLLMRHTFFCYFIIRLLKIISLKFQEPSVSIVRPFLRHQVFCFLSIYLALIYRIVAAPC